LILGLFRQIGHSLRATERFDDLLRPALGLVGFGDSVRFAEKLGPLMEQVGELDVVGSVDPLDRPERLVRERLGFVEPAPVAFQIGQVRQATGQVQVIGPW
jgi:hypothetical protein